MPTALVSCINGYATTVIQNYTEEQNKLVVTGPFKFSPIVRTNYIENNNNIDPMLLENLKNKLKTEHMNEEERTMITDICT